MTLGSWALPPQPAAAREAPRPKNDPFAQFCKEHGIYTPRTRVCPICAQSGEHDVRTRTYTTKNGEVVTEQYIAEWALPLRRLVIAGRGA